eukprot:3351276-Pleurochrysis_carterae.AAC.1
MPQHARARAHAQVPAHTHAQAHGETGLCPSLSLSPSLPLSPPPSLTHSLTRLLSLTPFPLSMCPHFRSCTIECVSPLSFVCVSACGRALGRRTRTPNPNPKPKPNPISQRELVLERVDDFCLVRRRTFQVKANQRPLHVPWGLSSRRLPSRLAAHVIELCKARRPAIVRLFEKDKLGPAYGEKLQIRSLYIRKTNSRRTDTDEILIRAHKFGPSSATLQTRAGSRSQGVGAALSWRRSRGV